MIHVLIAAVLFGLAAPLSKLLLGGWSEVALAGVLYASSGVGLTAIRAVKRGGEPLRRQDLRWLAGAVLFGGIGAPIAMLYGLRFTTGYAGALLVNLETVFTGILAVTLFRERLNGREYAAIAVLVAGACAVGYGSAAAREAAHPLLGAALIALACFGWGLDNNFTQRISDRDPLQIAGVKGLVAGTVNIILALALGQSFPKEAGPWALAAGVGLCCYGISLALFVIALRRLGAARTAALFATAPVSGIAASWIVLHERPAWASLAGGAVMVAGVLWLALIPKSAPAAAPS